MKILLYISHPAQFLFFKNFIYKQIEKKSKVKILIKSKDVLEELVRNEGFEYVNIIRNERKNTKIAIALNLIVRIMKIMAISIKYRSTLLIGTDASIAIVGFFTHTPCITTLEDDYYIIPKLVNTTYPFTSSILTPEVCMVGEKWDHKKIGYNGYMKLAYLHPNYFKPSNKYLSGIDDSKYIVIRLSKLSAHHDENIEGIDNRFLNEIISKANKYSYKVFISSERELPKELENLKLTTPTNQIHNVIYYSSLLICDSQSMSVEAAIIGTPSIRISDFVGKINVLEELEHKYQLTFGFSPSNKVQILNKIEELLSSSTTKQLFINRKNTLLHDKINVTDFLIWFIENYPNSKIIMKENPDYQYKFR